MPRVPVTVTIITLNESRHIAAAIERYQKKGRDYVVMTIDLRRASDGKLLIAYRDTAILAYRGEDAAAA